jgi:hypothetical protein
MKNHSGSSRGRQAPRVINPHACSTGFGCPSGLRSAGSFREGKEAICLPNLLRGRQGLRLAFV